MNAQELYAAMLAFLREHGWQRVEQGDGWWHHSDGRIGENTLGDAVELTLIELEGIDVREEPT